MHNQKQIDKKTSKAGRTLAMLGSSKGGKASAAALSPDARSDRARKAVAARWERYRDRQAHPTRPAEPF
jgi:hypothetical protein